MASKSVHMRNTLALSAPSPRFISCPGIPYTVFGDAGQRSWGDRRGSLPSARRRAEGYSDAAVAVRGAKRREDGEQKHVANCFDFSLFVILLFLSDFLDLLFLSDGRGRLAAAAASTDSFPPSVSTPVGHVPRAPRSSLRTHTRGPPSSTSHPRPS